MTYVPEDGLMKRHAVERSSKVYLMMESKKFGFQANYVYAGFEDISGVICEKQPDESTRERLELRETEII